MCIFQLLTKVQVNLSTHAAKQQHDTFAFYTPANMHMYERSMTYKQRSCMHEMYAL